MAGDIIIKIDDKATADLSLNDNVKLMRGKPNTSIVLTIARKGVAQPVIVKLTRAIIKVQSVQDTETTSQSPRIYPHFQFQERTAEDVAKALRDLNASGQPEWTCVRPSQQPWRIVKCSNWSFCRVSAS